MRVRTRWEPVARGLEDIGSGADGALGLSCAVLVPWSEPAGALVLLHGRGTDEHDVFPLLELLDPQRRLLGVAVRGPLESVPPGHAYWFEKHTDGRPVAESLASAVAGVGRWLDMAAGVIGVPLSRTVLGGFGEGGALALALALRGGRSSRPAGLILLAASAPAIEDFAFDAVACDGFPVAMGEGLEDTVVPPAQTAALRAQLERAGAAVTARGWHGGHAVDPAFLRELAPWLYRVIADARHAEDLAAESSRGFSVGSSVARPPVLW